MRGVTLTIAVVVCLTGCGKGGSTASRDSLTERQRDSVIGASQLPGAQGIRGALRVSDSAAARRDREGAPGQ